MEKIPIDLNEPIEPHVRGRDKWPYWRRFYWAILLILGQRIQFSFCNSFEACFNGEKFIGLNYLGSTSQIVIGTANMADIEHISPTIHLVIDETLKKEK